MLRTPDLFKSNHFQVTPARKPFILFGSIPPLLRWVGRHRIYFHRTCLCILGEPVVPVRSVARKSTAKRPPEPIIANIPFAKPLVSHVPHGSVKVRFWLHSHPQRISDQIYDNPPSFYPVWWPTLLFITETPIFSDNLVNST